jgi:hypothetical protein
VREKKREREEREREEGEREKKRERKKREEEKQCEHTKEGGQDTDRHTSLPPNER